MTFKTVGTFEKEGSNIITELLLMPEWQNSELFFVAQDEESSAIGSLFFESTEVRTNEDRSYFETHIYFHSEEKFLEWWEAYGAIHEEIFIATLAKIADLGITVHRYFDNPALVEIENALPMSDFVGRENLIINPVQ